MTTGVLVGAEKSFYREITDEKMSGLEKFRPEDFRPTTGNILIVLPPQLSVTEGGIVLPSESRPDQSAGRVAAIPDDPSLHGVIEVGDWVVFRAGAGEPVQFAGRTDLRLLTYVDGPASDIFGVVPRALVDFDLENS